MPLKAFASAPAEVFLPGPGFVKKMLSDYHPPLKGTPADTSVYIQQGGQKGGTVLIVGGTHGNEPAGMLAATLVLETAKVKKGRLIVIPRANALNVTHSAPRQKDPLFFALDLPSGEKRWFRYGSRYTNPRYTPPGYSSEKDKNWNQINLNRCYPGSPDGSLTQQIAYAIMQLIKREKVDLAFDLHEAYQKSRLGDVAVVHQRALDFAAEVLLDLSEQGVELRLDASPKNMRGLSHREWGDHTGALAVLLETRNPLQIRYGRHYGPYIAQGGQRNQELCAKFDKFFKSKEAPRSLALRVARHVAAMMTFIKDLKLFYAKDEGRAREVIIEDVPSYKDIRKKGVGSYLSPPARAK